MSEMNFIYLYLYASCKVKISMQEIETTSAHIYRGKSEVPEGSKLISPCGSLVHPHPHLSWGPAWQCTQCMCRSWPWRTTTFCMWQSFPELLYLQLRVNCVCPEQLAKLSLEHKPKQWFQPPILENIFWYLQTQGYAEGKCHREKQKIS